MPSTIDRRALLGAAAAGAVLTAAPRVHAEDAAAKPATPMPSIETYAQTPVIDEIALSPNGARCAIVTQKGDEKYLMTFAIGSDDKAKLIGLGPSKIRGLFWGDDTHVVLTASTTTALPDFAGGKHEFNVVRIVDPETLKISVLFGHEEGFYPMVTGDLGRVKTPTGYRVTASNVRVNAGEYLTSLYSFATNGVTGRLMDEASRDAEGWIIGPDGHVFALSEFDEEDKDWTLSYNTSANEKSINFKPIYKMRSPLDSPSLIGIGRDGKSVVIRLNDGFDFGRYHEISADGKLSDPIDADHEDKPRTALFHPVNGRLVGFMRHNDWFTYDYFDPFMKKLDNAVQQLMGPEYRVAHADFAEDPRKMILYGESATDAGTYYFSDFSNGNVITLASNYPAASPSGSAAVSGCPASPPLRKAGSSGSSPRKTTLF